MSTFRNTFGAAYEDAYIDRQQAAHTDAQDNADELAQEREDVIDEMVEALVAGKSVRYGSRFASGFGAIPLTLDASDVRDEIDGDELRYALVDCPRAEYVCELWEQAARRVCERHADEYLEWRATV